MMLADLQRAFQDAVLGADDGALGSLTETPRGGVAARIAIYRNTVQGSLAEVLAAAYPVVQRIVGQAFFAGLARRFVAAAPPRLPQLSAYGAGFPAFIAGDHSRHGLGYLADVARLEWARAESYFASDTAALEPAAIAAIAPDDLDGTVLLLHPATRLVRASTPIHRIWQVNQPAVADVPAVDMTIAENVLISRIGLRVSLRELGAGDAAFVAAIGAGATLGKALERAAAEDSAFDLEPALRDHLIGGTFRA
ncbi:MAG: HvfC/BufC family peptide modification chaperone [Rhodospirillaceae bacterium]